MADVERGAPEATDVVIIGAGLAGLTFASRLRERNVRCVVLEARERVGGRVHSVAIGDSVVDAGAGWVHGIVDNPVAAMVLAAGANLCATSRDNVWTTRDWTADVLALPDDSSAFSTDEIARAVRAYMALRDMVASEARGGERDQGPEAGAGRRASEAFQRASRRTESALSARERALVRWCATRAAMWFGTELDRVKLSDFAGDGEGSWGDYPGVHAVVPQGLSVLTRALADGVDVRLGAAARDVRYSADSVLVTCADGRAFVGRAAAVTVPIGVLQRPHALAFSPPLPPPHLNAIRATQMGAYEKVIMRFPTCFWPKHVPFLGAVPLASAAHAADAADPVRTDPVAPPPHFPLFLSYWPIKQQPLLVAFAMGASARALLSMDDAAVVRAAVQALARLLPRGTPVVQPEAAHVTRWGADPCAFGSYPNAPPDLPLAAAAALRRPVMGSLFFAGDGVYTEAEGSMHAAVLSGREQAEQLLKITGLGSGGSVSSGGGGGGSGIRSVSGASSGADGDASARADVSGDGLAV